MNYNLIYIPGWGSEKKVWDRIIKKVGFSGISIEWWESISEASDSFPNRLLDEIKNSEKPVILVGWSLGGLAALSASLKLKEKIAGLVLISSTARMIEDDNYPGTDKKFLRAMQAGLKRSKRTVMENFVNLMQSPQESMAFFVESLDMAERSDPEKLADGLTFLRNTDVRHQLNELNMPALIIHGKSDEVILHENGRYLSENLPEGKLLSLEEAGHGTVYFYCDLISNAIKEFVDATCY